MKAFQKWSILFLTLLFLTLLTACQGGGDPVPAEYDPPRPAASAVSAPAGPELKRMESEPPAPFDAESGDELPVEASAPSEAGGALPEESEPFGTLSAQPEEEAASEEPSLPENHTLYVLMYHSFVPEGTECNTWTLTDVRFREDLQWLASNGYTTVLPSELAEGKPLPEKAVMLTFDDGYENNYTVAYPILQEFQAKAVISPIVTHQFHRDLGYLSWEQCREMVESGLVEIGSHTYNCHNDSPKGVQRMTDESQEDYQARVFADLQTSINLIEENLETTVQFFAYPYGLTDKWCDSYLQEHFAVTVTTRHGSTDISNGLYKMNRCNISLAEPPSRTLPAG